MAHQRDYHDRAVPWLHEFAGRPARVYTDTFDGYRRGKPAWTTDDTGTEATVRIEWPRARAIPDREAGTGLDIDNDAVIIYDPDEVTVSDGAADTERRSIIEDERTGKRYRVLRTRDEGGPLHFADCEDLQKNADDSDSDSDTDGGA